MFSEVGGLGEGFLADGALVGFFSVVRAEVRLERGLPGIGVATDVARVVSLERIPGGRAHDGAAGEADWWRRGVI